MRHVIIIASLILGSFAAVGVGPASADHNGCVGGGIGGTNDTPSIKGTVIEVGSHPYVLYVDVRHVATSEHNFSVWIYLESNGRQGLQRGGAIDYGPATVLINGEEACPDPGTPDTLLF